MAEKLPFTFTPNITRYLKEVIEVYEKRTQGVPTDFPFVGFSHTTIAYTHDEHFYSFSEANRKAFVEYIARNNAVVLYKDEDEEEFEENYILEDRLEFVATNDEEDETLDVAKGWGTHPWNMKFWVEDIRPVLALWKIYLSQKDSSRIAILDAETEQVNFDDKEGRLTYLNKSYTFHKGKDGKALRLRLFRKLWDERMHIVNEKTTQKGRPMTLEALTKYLGKRPSKTDIFNIESALRRKSMPIEIEKNADSVLLIVKENI